MVIQADSLYRGRFLVRSAPGEAANTPTVRGRLNISSFQLAATSWLVSQIDGSESPDGIGRIVDVYLYVPQGATAGETIIASLDLINVETDDDLYRAVSLDHFTLERLQIP